MSISLPSPHWIVRTFQYLRDPGRRRADDQFQEDQLRDELAKTAELVWNRIVVYGKKQLARRRWLVEWSAEEPTLISEVFEGVLCSVAQTFQRNPDHRRTIKDLGAYLFGIFKHRLNEVIQGERRRRLVVQFVPLSEVQDVPVNKNVVAAIDEALLLSQLTHLMNSWTKKTSFCYRLGYSWDEIGPVVGTDPNEAKKRFFYELKKLRLKIIPPK